MLNMIFLHEIWARFPKIDWNDYPISKSDEIERPSIDLNQGRPITCSPFFVLSLFAEHFVKL